MCKTARRSALPLISVLAALVGLGCSSSESKPPPHASTAQQVRTGAGEDGEVLLGIDVLVTDGEGAGVPCGEGTVQMDVEISRNGPDGPWVLIDSETLASTCTDSGGGDLALVLDNSGSVEEELAVLRSGARRVADQVLGDGGRLSLVRVSTDAAVKAELAEDRTELDGAIEDLFITNGWTALWDGIRMGNETLGAGQVTGPVLATHSGTESFCGTEGKQGILVFTDGVENNSSHQKLWSEKYSGDGIDTQFEDLLVLGVAGAQTPIYVVGLGDDIDQEALSQLATRSGGRFVELDEVEQVDDMLETISEYFSSAHRVCTEVPAHLCGALDVRVTHRWTNGVDSTESSSLHHLDVPCDARVRGRVATILLTMDATETSEDTMMTLVANSVNWVSPVDAPRVLFVLDDFHHGEFSHDTHQLYEKLVAVGYNAEYLEEPELGLTIEDVAGFDVVWFSNPGYPMDDAGTFNTLLQFSEGGGGVVFQGDDMSYAYGKGFPTTPLTRLENVDNGTQYCGTKIDNGRGGRYRVTMSDGPHGVLEGIEGASFLYGDDIDTATSVSDETEVLAWATVEGKDNCTAKPVITVYTPSQ